MRQNLLLFGLLLLCLSCSEQENSSELGSLLSEQLKFSHTDENWFVPTQIAIDGLTSDQANWKDSTANHSIAELISHLAFWNDIQLRAFKGEDFSDFQIDNDTTFKSYTEEGWNQIVHKLDSVQLELKQLTENANGKELSEWASNLSAIASHNAYHAGQIVYIRKRNGWWNRK